MPSRKTGPSLLRRTKVGTESRYPFTAILSKPVTIILVLAGLSILAFGRSIKFIASLTNLDCALRKPPVTRSIILGNKTPRWKHRLQTEENIGCSHNLKGNTDEAIACKC